MLEIPGRYVEGVMGFRNLADLETLIRTAANKEHAVILGGGLLGLEVADGFRQRGMHVTVINRAEHLLNRQIDRTSAGLLQRQLEKRGISFRLGVTIAEIISKQQQIKQVRLCNDDTVPADLLVMATGIRPNITLAQRIGLPFRHGIIVNDHMQTGDDNVYAAGECVEHRGDVFGMVAPIFEQAKVCARQLAGNSKAFYQTPLSATVLKVPGIDLFTIGDFEGGTDSQQQILIDHGLDVYRKIVTKNDSIGGVILYGDTSDSHIYQNLITSQINIAPIRDRLVFNQPTLTI
jgi:nitrite reductase (NADH) large subunit